MIDIPKIKKKSGYYALRKGSTILKNKKNSSRYNTNTQRDSFLVKLDKSLNLEGNIISPSFIEQAT